MFDNNKTCPGHVIFICTRSPKSVMGTGGCKLVAKSNCVICYKAKFRQISSSEPLEMFANNKTSPGHVIIMCTRSPKSVMGTGGCKLVAKSNCAICY